VFVNISGRGWWMASWQDEHRVRAHDGDAHNGALAWARAQPPEQHVVVDGGLNDHRPIAPND
jgi:hypothetical protein